MIGPNVVGIDLSLTATGIAGCGWARLVTSAPAKPWDGRHARIMSMRDQILTIVIGERQPDLVVIETPYDSGVTGSAHDRSGLWWMVVNDLLFRSVPVAYAAPKQRAKYVTGTGSGDKGAVQEAFGRRFGGVWSQLGNNNLVDAAVLCAMGMDHLGHPLVEMPKVNREALGKISWPEDA